jgi:toxin YoeB
MVKRKKVIWSDKAKQDLVEILNFYYLRNGDIGYSAKLFKKFSKDITLVSSNPFLGKKTDHENVRVLIVWNYLIFYEYHPTMIFITTIWNSRRKPEKIY